jgi:hypothetical protein
MIKRHINKGKTKGNAKERVEWERIRKGSEKNLIV